MASYLTGPGAHNHEDAMEGQVSSKVTREVGSAPQANMKQKDTTMRRMSVESRPHISEPARPRHIELLGADQSRVQQSNLMSPRRMKTPQNVHANEYFAQQVESHQRMLNPLNFRLPERAVQQIHLPASVQSFQYNGQMRTRNRGPGPGFLSRGVSTNPVNAWKLSPDSPNLRRSAQWIPAGNIAQMVDSHPRPGSTTKASAMDLEPLHRAPWKSCLTYEGSDVNAQNSMAELPLGSVAVINKSVDDFVAAEQGSIKQAAHHESLVDQPFLSSEGCNIEPRHAFQDSMPSHLGDMKQQAMSVSVSSRSRRPHHASREDRIVRDLGIDTNLRESNKKKRKFVRDDPRGSDHSGDESAVQRVSQTYLFVNEKNENLYLDQRSIDAKHMCKIFPDRYPIFSAILRLEKRNRFRSLTLPTDFGPASAALDQGRITQTVLSQETKDLLALGGNYLKTGLEWGINQEMTRDLIASLSSKVQNASGLVAWLDQHIAQAVQRMPSYYCYGVNEDASKHWVARASIWTTAMKEEAARVWKSENAAISGGQESTQDIADRDMLVLDDGERVRSSDGGYEEQCYFGSMEKDLAKTDSTVLKEIDDLMSLEDLEILLNEELGTPVAEPANVAKDYLHDAIITAVKLDDVFIDDPSTEADEERPAKRRKRVFHFPSISQVIDEAEPNNENHTEIYGMPSLLSGQQGNVVAGRPFPLDRSRFEDTSFYETPQTSYHRMLEHRDSEASDASFKTAPSDPSPTKRASLLRNVRTTTSNISPDSSVFNPRSPLHDTNLRPIRSVMHAKVPNPSFSRKRRHRSDTSGLSLVKTLQAMQPSQLPSISNVSPSNSCFTAPPSSSLDFAQCSSQQPFVPAPQFSTESSYGPLRQSPVQRLTGSPVMTQDETATSTIRRSARAVFEAVERRNQIPSTNHNSTADQWGFANTIYMPRTSNGNHRRTHSSFSRFAPTLPKLGPSPVVQGQGWIQTSPLDRYETNVAWQTAANQRYQQQLIPHSPSHRPSPRPSTHLPRKTSLNFLQEVAPGARHIGFNTIEHKGAKNVPSMNSRSEAGPSTTPRTPTTPTRSREGVKVTFKSAEEKSKRVVRLADVIAQDTEKSGYEVVGDLSELEIKVTGPIGANLWGWMQRVCRGDRMQRCFGAI